MFPLSALRARLVPVAAAAALVAGASCASAPALPLPNGYPRTIAGVGIGDGVALSTAEADYKVLSGNRVRVNVYGTATADATRSDRRLILVVARCTGSASSPDCPATASLRTSLPRGGTRRVHRAFTVRRPASRPDALRVLWLVTRTSSVPIPTCSAGLPPGRSCLADRRFTLVGDLLLSGGTWRWHQGARYGGGTIPFAGLTVQQVFFNSRTYTWTVGPAAKALIVGTAMTHAGEDPARSYVTTVRTDRATTFRRTPSFGTGFQTRASTQTLVYNAWAVGGAGGIFTFRLPIPKWTYPPPTG